MELIGDRYFILDKLGQGGSSITYAAIDQITHEKVVVKALTLTGLEDWKKIELFEREAKILQQLNHFAIPQYLDYFKIETESNIYFYIVQQLASGQSLADLISQGWQPNEATVKNIAEQILEVLVYLQQLNPPVIHRDIKPQNIIYQPDTNKLFLVDFGAVQDTYHHTVMGSTVVGTYGYMAPEQYRGGAVLSTDLYSLGCTLLFLLIREFPANLPQNKLKLRFRNAVNIKRNFADWIDKLIEPNVNNRFPTAEAALLVLHEEKSIKDYRNKAIEKPRYTSIKISQAEEKIIIDIPPPYQRERANQSFYFLLLWTIISVLNRLAILLSINLVGKIYIIIGFYNMILNHDKADSWWEYLFLLLYIKTISPDYDLTIPAFSIYLIFIDIVIKRLVNHNFVRSLLLSTKITLQKDDFFPNSGFANRFIIVIARKGFVDWHTKYFKYSSQSIHLLKNFITAHEQSWLQAEIHKYIDLNEN